MHPGYFLVILLLSLKCIRVDAQFLDCDFDYDCQSCIANGCYWCPGDARCASSTSTPFNVFSHCTRNIDYVQDTCTDPGNFFTDPMYSGQAWVYDMINVRPVWERQIFGNGVRVRINDNGVDASHLEFAGRFDIDSSCDSYLPPQQNGNSLPSSHGTSVAAIVGAGANNGECSVGIAPEVTLSACYAFDGSNFLDVKVDTYDISQNSYGIDGCQVRQRRLQSGGTCPFTYSFSSAYPCSFCDFSSGSQNFDRNCEEAIVSHCQRHYENDVLGCSEFLDVILGGNCLYDVLDERERNALTKGIYEGRDGKGVIYVFAAGNAFSRGDDTNTQIFTKTRFVLSVGAVGKDGRHARYSTPGTSLFITAPGGDFENASNLITAGVGGTCRDAGSGTSFSCPVISGVIALMLEANPELTWRDVQNILAITSTPVADPNDDTAQRNGVGIWHSNLYGFGIVNAAAAVEVSLDWENVGTEIMLVEESGPLSLPIVDSSNKVTESMITVDTGESNMVVESVVAQLDLDYVARGHLEVVLTSPQGMKSVLHPGRRPENTLLDTDQRWKLLTVRTWGEDPNGEWTLSIVDLKAGDAGECVSAPWEILINGGDQTIDCNYLERAEYCLDGELDPSNVLRQSSFNYIFNALDNGRTAADACCPCGGGIDRDQISDRLRQWRLVVYGREGEFGFTNQVATLPPSATPSQLPSTTPSTEPTLEPSSIPSSGPSQSPSTEPSLDPTEQPSLLPSMKPSGTPTLVPSQSLSPSSLPTVSKAPSLIQTIPVGGQTPISTSPSMLPSLVPSVTSTSPSWQPSIRLSQSPNTFQDGTQADSVPGGDVSSVPSQNPSQSMSPSQSPTLSSTSSLNPTEETISSGALDTDEFPSATPTVLDPADGTDSPTARPSLPQDSDLPTVASEPDDPLDGSNSPTTSTSIPSEAPSLQASTMPSRTPSWSPTVLVDDEAPSTAPSQDLAGVIVDNNAPVVPPSTPTPTFGSPAVPTLAAPIPVPPLRPTTGVSSSSSSFAFTGTAALWALAMAIAMLRLNDI